MGAFLYGLFGAMSGLWAGAAGYQMSHGQDWRFCAFMAVVSELWAIGAIQCRQSQ